jgi:flagellin-specific chaperone FliS
MILLFLYHGPIISSLTIIYTSEKNTKAFDQITAIYVYMIYVFLELSAAHSIFVI